MREHTKEWRARLLTERLTAEEVVEAALDAAVIAPVIEDAAEHPIEERQVRSHEVTPR